jgi:D-alanine-D-alanine ligase
MSAPPLKPAAPPRIRVAVLYGGRSGEHEISLQSAASVLRNLDRERFEAIPIAIDQEGRWHPGSVALIAEGARSLPGFAEQPPVLLPPSPRAGGAELVPYGEAPRRGLPLVEVDVVFPVMHGTLCEDGTIQGLLELADLPYVGCGVLASAVGMDKEVAKRLAQAAGLPIVPYVLARQPTWEKDFEALATRIAQSLGYPCFVKPACCGSSVGVHKVKTAEELRPALADAFRYDRKVLIEKAIDAREIEVAVLENPDPAGPPLCSIPGEINPRHEFYSYAAKYLDENGAELLIPAHLTGPQVAAAQQLAADAFTALECEGMARCDFFLDRKTAQLYFNEVNTIPGFTSISMYPKMWEASGIPYRELLSRLIDLALRRGSAKQALVRDYKA